MKLRGSSSKRAWINQLPNYPTTDAFYIPLERKRLLNLALFWLCNSYYHGLRNCDFDEEHCGMLAGSQLVTGEYSRSSLRGTADLAILFEYEIFAYGGIDVNLSLGYRHRYFNQREIAFSGEIRPEFIRTAREYDSEGMIVRIWVNGGFDIAASREAHSSHLCQLPDPVCGSRVSVVYWWGEDPDQPGPSNRELRDAKSQFDAMREEGDQAVDTLMDDSNTILPVKFISGDDAPADGHEYAINILGTTKVLTSTNNTRLILETWHGFICKGASGGSGRYMSYNSSETIVFQAHYQSKWKYVLPRADPAGRFTLWMFKDEHLAPILQVSATQFKMMAQSGTRFGFTQLDSLSTLASTPPDFWAYGLREQTIRERATPTRSKSTELTKPSHASITPSWSFATGQAIRNRASAA
ncbi:hypothetical protein HD806DRAFT_553104 [Xylariaceae sp. AK1471]|nr:hypothetical protein HD806DRAFT_553104 [Xylariaceae sp. AK1471]